MNSATTHVIAEEIEDDMFKYRIALCLGDGAKSKTFKITKITVLEQLIRLILPVYYSTGEVINTTIKMHSNCVGVSLLTLELNNGYRANIHKETVIIAYKLGILTLINGKLAASKRSKTGETIKFTDDTVVDYRKWLNTQYTDASFNYINPSKNWQYGSIY